MENKRGINVGTNLTQRLEQISEQQERMNQPDMQSCTRNSVNTTRVDEGYHYFGRENEGGSRVTAVYSNIVHAATDFAGKHPNCCIVNFADPRTPGGGYTSGRDGQEESLCSSSNLY